MGKKRPVDALLSMREPLVQERAELADRYSSNEEENRTIEHRMGQIDAVLRIIDQDSPLPAPKKVDVIAAVASVLEGGPMSKQDLKKAVAERLSETHSLTGYAVCFKHALRSPDFVVDDSGVRHAKPAGKAKNKLERPVHETPHTRSPADED